MISHPSEARSGDSTVCDTPDGPHTEEDGGQWFRRQRFVISCWAFNTNRNDMILKNLYYSHPPQYRPSVHRLPPISPPIFKSQEKKVNGKVKFLFCHYVAARI